ncbi:fungal Zn(2)-Cys(6) binuclear cluster domain containing protein [Acanthamoeba castellanii str. Neff]|uniref:Fungal Zn(2)-Cys(6) binuclear cluster domain containing protein n=1 Tax=Acanthamoeba castellanii (strain ATCC 30010 / Neff) TaxID=1257118 RepID=L8GWZ1_ACACF|nr:fungal Zn(2)-Cys(6) binuclear cluster domain containing protein [Acanthamoeba castellanii str. Neff]ELR17520.1 fungal Zn(2)-Cys(6) binuclear cluster domain containing protein [Acanthamoeba castellanii str. Neff]
MDGVGKQLDANESSNANASLSAKVEDNGDGLIHHEHDGHDHNLEQHHHHDHQHEHLHHHDHGHEHHHHGDDEEEHTQQHLEHHHHHHHHHQSAEEAAAEAHHHQVADLQHGAYGGLSNDQLQAINSASSSVAQAHALQHHIQQQLQHQLHGPFPFAYQTLPPLPPPGSVAGGMGVVGLPAHLVNGGGSGIGNGGGGGAMPAHLVNGGNVAGGGMPAHLVNGGIEDAQQVKARPKRKQVKSACLNCRKRKTGCDAFRPCTKCVRNGLESTCMDVPRKKRSSNRAKTNATVTPLSADSSPSPSSSPALGGVAPSSVPTFASPLSSQLQYMSAVNLGQANGTQISMTWEEITKHVASAQNNGGNISLVPPELAWKGNEGLLQPGSMTPAEQSK